jgi:hypothetical protein
MTGRRVAELVVSVGLTLALVIAGFLHRGVPAAQVVLNDGGVWVINTSLRLVGHLNAQSRTLDGGLRAASSSFDVLQAGASVLIDDRDGGTHQRVDPSTVAIAGQLVNEGLDVRHGNATLFVADGDEGSVWAVAAEDLAGFDTSQEPLIEDAGGVRLAATVSGTGLAVEPSGAMHSVQLGPESGAVVEEAGSLDAELAPEAELTTVGEDVVALDEAGGKLITPYATIDLVDGESAVLQLPGPASTDVLVATADALFSYPLRGGDAVRIEAGASGTPARPSFHEGCGYGVWGGSGAYIRSCPQTADDVVKTYPDLASARDLSFRTNRKVIVINDNVSGDVYLPNDGMQVVNNWDIVESQIDDEEEDDSSSSDLLDESVAPEFSEDNSPPEANPDEFGVRAGRATTLPVLANDTDPDGDVLTVVLEDQPKGVSIGATRGERAARVDVPAGQTGSFSFSYGASDGRETSEPAQVTVRVVPDGVNEPPKPLRTARLNITERSSVTYSVLPDWTDPEGDQVYLKSAAAPEGMRVEFRQDGTLTVEDQGKNGSGLREIDVVVSDGQAESVGVVRVQVSPYGVNLPPVANADFYWGNVGEAVTVNPLSNDTDPNGDDLTLTELSEAQAGTTVTPDFLNSRFTFAAEAAGTYFVPYTVTDGPSASRNEVRIDVIDPLGESTPPVAENDLVVLPDGSAALADVLTNDFDPLGGVLVVNAVNVSETSGLTVEILNHAQLRVTSPAGLDGPTSFTYTISNGSASATATVMVLPIAAESTTMPPVAVDDDALVRAGDIVGIPVLRNDYSPTNMQFELLPEVEVNSEGDLGEAFVSGDQLRFRAGMQPGQARITYTIRDSAGNVASAEARVTVVPFEKRNQAPQPRALTSRVVAGNSVAIPVPVDGVDPDGDMVQIMGFAAQPAQGQAQIERGMLIYTAPSGAFGTDDFEYVVQDRFGAQGTAQVRVGIAPPPSDNQSPVAVTDNVAARPGVEIEVEATKNDTDPDGDNVILLTDSIEPVDDSTTTPTVVEGQRVRLIAPDEPGTLQYYYRISDGNGGTARGVITVLVDEDVPLAAPVAVDDPLAPADVLGKSDVRVDVLTNDSDPDGSIGALTLEVESPGRVDGDDVVVPVSAERQVILYTVTDPDGLTSRAAVIVPGGLHTPPALNPELIPATVKAGDPLVIDLRQYVMTRAGREAILTSGTKVEAGQGWDRGAPLVTGDQSLTFTAEADYVGESYVSFEVTDGETIEDPRGLKSTLSIPIVVESSGLNQPILRPSEITVAPGEDPETVDLSAMAQDPDAGDQGNLQYSVGETTGPFSVTGEGGSMLVSAPADAAVGTTGSVLVTVTDGSTEPVSASVPLSVSSSTRPLPTTRDVDISEGRSGETTSVDLAPYVTNPFADTGKPMTIPGSPSVSPEGSGTVSVSGMTVRVTPAASFDGQMVVTYQVADATLDSSRFATGVIRVTVKGESRPPSNVSAVTNASKSATVSWTAGDLRGGVLRGFTVSWAGGSHDCGIRTVCDLNRLLENNRDYTFTVTQTTDVGDSAPSAPSNVVRPDVRPNSPSVPVATFGDGQISLTWQDGGVPDGGSPVDRYTVEVRPAVGGVTQQDVTGGRSLTWTGLTNGTAYSFAVVAHNQFEQPSQPSGFSAPEIPAGQSGPPAAPSVSKDPVSSAAPRATVSWTPPAFSNGDTSYTYELRRTGSTAVLYSGSSTSTTVTMSVAVEDQTFEVRATNKSRLPSDWSARSNAVRAFQTPGAPGSFTLTPTGANNTARFNFTAAAGNGALPSEIAYRWSAGTASGVVQPGQSVTNGAFSHSGPVSVQLRAVSTVNGETAQGPQATASVHAYGPPRAPGVNASGNVNDVTLQWNATSVDNGRPVTSVQLDTSDTDTTTSSLSGSRTEGNGRSQTKCIRARAQDSTGQWGAWSSNACATTWAAPGFNFSNSGALRSTGIYYLNLDLRRYNPNSTVRCQTDGAGGYAGWWGVFRVDGSGNYSGRASGNAGGNGGLFSAPSYINGINADPSSCRQQ